MDPSTPEAQGSVYPRPGAEAAPLARNPWGWLLLALLFGFSILVAVRSSFRRGGADPAAALRPVERQIESYVAVGGRKPGVGAGVAEGIAGKGLDDLSAQLRRDHPREPRAGFLRALIARERGKAPSPDDLALAARLPAPAPRRAGRGATGRGEEAGAPEPDLRPAAALVREDRPAAVPAAAPGEPFLARLARAQARERAGTSRGRAREGLVAPGYLLRTGILNAALLGGVALALVLWVGFGIGQGTAALRTRGLPCLPMLRAEGDRFGLRAGLLFLGFFGLSALAGAIGTVLPQGGATAAGLVVYVAIAAYALRLPKDRLVPNLGWRGLRIDGENLGGRVLWGVGAAIANVPILLAVTVLSSKLFEAAPPPSHPATEALTGHPTLGVVALTFVLASVCAPIWEEVMFRGLLFQGIAGALGGSGRAMFAGAALSSFLFASIHPQGPAGWAGLMTVALMSCALVRKTGSLVPSMVMHATHNTLTLGVALLAGPILG